MDYISIPLTIVIPVALYEDQWLALLEQLRPIWGKIEILLVSEEEPDPLPFGTRWIEHSGTLNTALEIGVRSAKNRYVWILPADSFITQEHINLLCKALLQDKYQGYYFATGFLRDGPWLVWVTKEWMNIFAHIFGLPSLNHGVCLPKDIYRHVVALGAQDYVLKTMLAAKKKKCPMAQLPLTLKTSARRYKSYGWFYTTMLKMHRFIMSLL